MKTTLFFLILLQFATFGLNAQNVNKEYQVVKPGTLITQLTEEEANEITHLKLTGSINAQDFMHLRDEFIRLEVLDLSDVNIKSYAGKGATHPDKFYVYMAGNIPPYAFCKIENGKPVGKKTLKKVILPSKVRNIEDNAFLDCTALEICQIDKAAAPHLQPGALNDTITAIFVPKGSSDKYRQKPRWEEFVFMESEPCTATIDVAADSSLEAEIQRMGLHPKDINFMTVTGKMDGNDFKLIRDYMPNLVTIDMQNTTATVIPPFTFSHKKYLLRVSLPQGLKVIGERCFSNCSRLAGELVLPASMNAIDYGAFMGCTRLAGVRATGNQLNALGEDLFNDSNATLIR